MIAASSGTDALNPFSVVMVDIEPADGAASTHQVDMRGLTSDDTAGKESFREHSEDLISHLLALDPVEPQSAPLLARLFEAAYATARDHIARSIHFTTGWGARVEIRVVYLAPVV